MVALNSKGEICDLLDVSQFVPGKSAYECVAYSAALVKYAGSPGKGPTGTAIQASNLAQYWYGREEGGNDAANKNGMSLDAEHTMLGGMGLAWTPNALDLNMIRQSIREGRPALLCGAEDSYYDLALGDKVPYNWAPTGNHCIVASGVTADGNFLVHDCANVDSNGRIRPGPRVYDAAKMRLISSTSVSVPVPAPAPPVLPANWSDDGKTLSTPTGKAVLGFRQEILNLLHAGKWDADDFIIGEQFYNPQLELSNTALGPGDQLITNKHLLAYPHNPTGSVAHLKNTVVVEYVGKELDACRRKLLEYQARLNQPAPPIALPQDEAAIMQFLAQVAPQHGWKQG